MNKNMDKVSFDIYDLDGELYNDDLLEIHLLLTNVCNQSCSYCLCNDYPYIKNRKFLTDDEFYRVMEFIKIQKRKKVDFYFFGGEPSIHPNLHKFNKIVDEELGVMLNRKYIFTNLTRSVEYYKELTGVIIIASFHSAEVKNWDEWWNKLIELKDQVIIIKVVLTEDNLEEVIKLFEKYKPMFPKKTHDFDIHAIDQLSDEFVEKVKPIFKRNLVFDDSDNIRLTNDKSCIMIDGDQVPKERHKEFESCHSFSGMMCKSGFCIRENGNIARCFFDVHRGRYIMNIFEEKLRKIDIWGYALVSVVLVVSDILNYL